MASIAADRAVELDYHVMSWGTGRRWRDVTLGEMCTIVYGWAVNGRSTADRKKFDHDLSPDELVAIFDESVPEELRGVRPPSWWTG